MTKDFEDRLKATAERLDAKKQDTVSTQGRRKLAEEAQVAKLNDAIQNWNGQIVPIIARAIAQANKIGNQTGIEFNSVAAPQRFMQFDRLGPPVPPIPSMVITAQPGDFRKNRVAGRIAGAPQRKATIQDYARSPRLQIALNIDAKMTITPFNYKSATHTSLETKDFKEEYIEKAILDLIDATLGYPTK